MWNNKKPSVSTCFLAILVLILNDGNSNNECWCADEEGAISERIYNGSEVLDRKRVCYMVTVIQLFDDGTELLCGGAIIAESHVLTAAHCIAANETGRNVRVLANHTTIADSGGVHVKRVSEIRIPEGYGSKTVEDANTRTRRERFYNDIALLKVSEPFRFDEFNCRLTLMTDWNNYDRRNCIVSGWGATETAEDSDTIRQVSVPVHNGTECEKLAPLVNVTVQFCAGHSDGTQGCEGDSGGPLVCNGNLIAGVLSQGSDECGNVGSPEIYTRVSFYNDWIKAIVGSKT